MSWPVSPPNPPRHVLYTSALPEGFRAETKASSSKQLVSKAPGVVGKSVEQVLPVTYTAPSTDNANPSTRSQMLPPRKVLYTNERPDGSSLVMNPSPPAYVVSNAPGVVGKSCEAVRPPTYTDPSGPNASAHESSRPRPPMNVL